VSAAEKKGTDARAELAALLPEDKLTVMVRREQVALLYQQLPTSIAGTLVGMAVLAMAMWPVSPHLHILLWCVWVLANQSWRATLYFGFRRLHTGRTDAARGLRDEDFLRWGNYWAIGSGISGVLWGASAWLFFAAESPLHQAVLTVLVFGITAGAVPLIASHTRSFYVFLLPALLPFVLRNFLEDDLLHGLLGVVTFTVMLALISFGRNHNRLLIESLRNRFQNAALAERLRQQNDDLALAREAAAAASRSKTQFFAAASHDLRQPLHALGLFASALSAKVREPEAVHLVASVNASAHALEELFNEILDISKIDAGVIQPVLATLPADRVLERLRMDFEPEAFEKGLRFRMRRCAAYVRTDPVLLERILRNLVGNALRYTEKGGVLVGCRRRGDKLVFEVRDSGIGIADAHRQKVFEEFYQVGNPERSSKRGLGLGLSIVRRLSDLLGHEIELASWPGRGTRFRVVVPIGPQPLPPPVSERRELRGDSDISGRLIVVIDDETAIQEGMQVLLGSWGAEVMTSPDGEDIVARVQEAGRLPDLIIADYRLAGNRVGTEVIARLHRELDPAIPAIMVTGSSTPERSEEAARSGYHLMIKPVIPEKLRALIAFKLRETPVR
jgi:signal transduction histidine kinase